MGPPSPGEIVIVRFPFSDLTSSKWRPEVVLARYGLKDLILCQITSNAYADPRAIVPPIDSLTAGSLDKVSYARPGKLFAADISLVGGVAGTLSGVKFDEILQAVISLFRK